jgi:CheY-like chemotaxis protein
MDRRRPRNPRARPLVFLVEGHEDTRAMYAFALFASGFDVVPTQDGPEAYARAWEHHPDVIVADLPTPHQGGWAFLHVLKRDARTRDIPVVVVSGFGQPSLRESVECERCAAVFPKPCPPDELVAGLRELFNCQRPSTPGQDSATTRCPQCRKNTLVFKNRVPIVSATTAWTRTGTDSHDGPDRLQYESAWVCQDPRCDYRERVGGA